LAYIRQISERAANGMLKRIYAAAKSRAGKVANIIKVMSLDAATNQASMQFYVSLMKSSNPLDAASREMLATVVSNANGCFY
jgi:alkylhydroperoxidase family enzyme